MSTSTATRNHEEIRRWADARGAIPSEVESTHSGSEPGILRFHFPNSPGEKDRNLREISWDAFFEKFDESDLELVYQEKTAQGERSNFNKLVHAEQSSSSSQKKASSQRKESDDVSDESDAAGEDEIDEDEEDE